MTCYHSYSKRIRCSVTSLLLSFSVVVLGFDTPPPTHFITISHMVSLLESCLFLMSYISYCDFIGHVNSLSLKTEAAFSSEKAVNLNHTKVNLIPDKLLHIFTTPEVSNVINVEIRGSAKYTYGTV